MDSNVRVANALRAAYSTLLQVMLPRIVVGKPEFEALLLSRFNPPDVAALKKARKIALPSSMVSRFSELMFGSNLEACKYAVDALVSHRDMYMDTQASNVHTSPFNADKPMEFVFFTCAFSGSFLETAKEYRYSDDGHAVESWRLGAPTWADAVKLAFRDVGASNSRGFFGALLELHYALLENITCSPSFLATLRLERISSARTRATPQCCRAATRGRWSSTAICSKARRIPRPATKVA